MFFKKKVIIKKCEFSRLKCGCTGTLIVKIPKQKDEHLYSEYLYPYEDIKILGEPLWHFWGHTSSSYPEMKESSKHHRVSFKVFEAKNFSELLEKMDKETKLKPFKIFDLYDITNIM
jgi:hypothetical protein